MNTIGTLCLESVGSQVDNINFYLFFVGWILLTIQVYFNWTNDLRDVFNTKKINTIVRSVWKASVAKLPPWLQMWHYEQNY